MYPGVCVAPQRLRKAKARKEEKVIRTNAGKQGLNGTQTAQRYHKKGHKTKNKRDADALGLYLPSQSTIIPIFSSETLFLAVLHVQWRSSIHKTGIADTASACLIPATYA